MIEPKEIELDGRKYVISKLPATVGREIITQYPISNIPKVGDYKASKELMLKLMSYVAVNIDGQELRLTTEDLINNHVRNGEVLISLEKEMFAYNFDFFTNGNLSSFLGTLEKVAGEKVTEILTTLSGKLSALEKQASMS